MSPSPWCGSFPQTEALRRLPDRGAEAEQLRISHQGSGGSFAEGRQRRNQGRTRRRTDADLRLTAELGHRQPATVELPEPDTDLDAQLLPSRGGR